MSALELPRPTDYLAVKFRLLMTKFIDEQFMIYIQIEVYKRQKRFNP